MPGFHRFAVEKNVANKSVTQKLAAASGVPPAFHEKLEPRCIFPQVGKCRRHAGGIAVQCVASRHGILT